MGCRLGHHDKIFAYTNHTLLPEALETWPSRILGKLLPRHLQIIYEINRRFINFAKSKFGDDAGKLSKVTIVSGDGDNQIIRMANLSIVGSFSVNGVAKLHSELLKNHWFRNSMNCGRKIHQRDQRHYAAALAAACQYGVV